MDINGGRVVIEFEADLKGFNEELESARSSLQGIAKDSAATSGNNGIKQLNNDAKAARESVDSLGTSVKNLATGTLQVGATALTGALTSLVSKGIQATDFLETARVSMSGLTGSIAAGNKAMSIAANYWQNNPFQRIDVTKATQQLVQFGRSTNVIADDLKTLGNVSLSSGVAIDELARYYARTAASGRAMTMDIEMMSDRGIPIYRELAKQLGTTEAGVRDMASKGKVDFETFRKAMEGAVDPEAMEQYNDTLARQRDRLSGSISMLAGDLAGYKVINDQLVISANGLEKTWVKLVNTLATGLRSEPIRKSMEQLGNTLAQLLQKIFQFYETIEVQADGTEKLVQHSKTLETVFNGLGKAMDFVSQHSAALVPILGASLVLFGKMGSSIPGIGPIIGVFSESIGGITKNLGKLAKEKPKILGLFGVLTALFASALINSEEFRAAIGNLGNSLLKLTNALAPAISSIAQSFASFASSGAFTSVLTSLVNILASLADVISSFPTPVLEAILTALGTFFLLRKNAVLGYATAIVLVVGALRQFVQEAGIAAKIGDFLSNAFENIGNFFKSIGKSILTAGYNIMVGLLNGLIEGTSAVVNYVKSVAQFIVDTFKKAMAIHSPSRVMAELGKNVGLGLADGITNSKSVVQKAMDNLATATLKAAEKVIDNKVDFNILDVNGEYKAWQKVSNLFVKGSTQYQTAIQKMEDARKKANQQIIKLQQQYNDTLDDTIDKIAHMYGTFETVNLTGGMDSSQIISNMDKQLAQMEEWASSQDIIMGLNLDEGFIEELQQLGVESVNELSAIANMTSGELEQLNDLWVKKQEVANKAAVRQLGKYKDETLSQIAALKDGIDGETVEVADVGGRLVANIGEGVTGALPTLESAYAQLDDYMAAAAKELAKSSGKSTADAFKSSGLNTEAIADTWKEPVDEAKDSIGKSIEEMGQSLVGQLGGVVAGVLAFKFGPKILKALGGTKIGQKIKPVFSGIGDAIKKFFGKGGEALKEAETAVSQSGNLAKQTQVVTKNVGSVSTELTRGQKLAKTITRAAGAMAAIAGAIAALAIALRIAYEALHGIDWLEMAADLTAMGIAVTEMGGLALAADKVKINGKSVLKLVEIAGAILALGVALAVLDRAIPNESIGTLSLKLLVMGEAVTAMGGLAAAADRLKITGKSFLKLVEIAGTLLVLGVALAAVDRAIPNESIGTLALKIVVMGEAVAAIGGLATVAGKVAKTVGKGLFVLVGVAADLVLLALALQKVDQSIADDALGRMQPKFLLMAEAVAGMAVLAGVIGSFPLQELAGVVIILGLALDIIAIAEAIKQVDEKVPADFGAFQPKMALMGEAIGGMGVLAGIIGAFAPFEAAGVLIILGLAEDIIRIADAIDHVNKVIPDDFGKLEGKMNLLKDNITAMGLITGVLGLVAPLEAAGVWAVKQNAEAIVQMATSIAIVDKLVPDDFGRVREKMTNVRDMIKYISQLDIGQIVGAIVTSWSAEPVEKIANMYANVAGHLNRLQSIELNVQAISKNMDIVSQAIDKVKSKTGIISGQLQAWSTEAEASTVEAAGRILKTYGDVVDALGKISNLKIEGDVNKNVDTITATIKHVVEKITGIQIDADMHAIEEAVAITQSVLNKFTEMIPTLVQISKMPFDYEKAKTNVQNTRNLVYELSQINQDVGDLKNKEWIVGMAKSLLNKFTELVPTVEQIAKEQINKDGALSNIKAIQDIIYQIVQVNQNEWRELENKEFVVEKAKSLLNKFTEIVPTANQIAGQELNRDAAIERIQGVQAIIYNITQVMQGGWTNLSDQEWIVAVAQSILNKFTELIPVADQIASASLKTDKAIGKIAGVHQIIGAITSMAGLSVEAAQMKEWLLAIAQSVVNKMTEITATASSMKAVESTAIPNIHSVQNLLWEIFKVNEDVGDITNKQRIVTEAAMLAEDMTHFANAVAQIPDTGDRTGVVQALLDTMNTLVQGVIDSMSNYEGQIYLVGNEIGMRFGEGILAMQPIVTVAAITLQSAMWQGLQSKMEDEFRQGQAMAQKFADGVKSKRGDMYNAGTELQGQLWSGIQSKMNDEYWQGRALADKLKEGISSANLTESGRNAIQGFIDGANEKGSGYGWNSVWAVGRDIAKKFLEGLKKGGKEGSPWKTTFQSGNWAVEGLMDGIQSQERALVGEATSLAEEVADALSISDVTISPALDTSSIGARSVAPAMSYSAAQQYEQQAGKRNVIIEQTNNNYTKYSIDQVNRDLAWELSKV